MKEAQRNPRPRYSGGDMQDAQTDLGEGTYRTGHRFWIEEATTFRELSCTPDGTRRQSTIYVGGSALRTVSLTIDRGVVQAEPGGDKSSEQGQAEDVVGTADARIAVIDHGHQYHTGKLSQHHRLAR
jgi:hypothetical protein